MVMLKEIVHCNGRVINFRLPRICLLTLLHHFYDMAAYNEAMKRGNIIFTIRKYVVQILYDIVCNSKIDK